MELPNTCLNCNSILTDNDTHSPFCDDTCYHAYVLPDDFFIMSSEQYLREFATATVEEINAAVENAFYDVPF